MEKYDVQQEKEQGADHEIEAWTLKYPNDVRRLLSDFGVDDRGIPALEAFNRKLIELGEVCNGKSWPEFEVSYEGLCEDWAGILRGTVAECFRSRFRPRR